MAVSDYSTVASSNTEISGIFIGEGCAPANINDAIRTMMADLASLLGQMNSGTAGFMFMPIGGVVAFAGGTAPTGFMMCYGQAISRTDYADLFAAIGTTYGTGDGSTTFNLPDLRDRTIVGVGAMGGSDADRVNNYSTGRGNTGGADTHSLTYQENGPHDHSGTTGWVGDHSHVITRSHRPVSIDAAMQATVYGMDGNGVLYTEPAGGHNHTFVTDPNGYGQPHNNMQPFIALNYIIRAS